MYLNEETIVLCSERDSYFHETLFFLISMQHWIFRVKSAEIIIEVHYYFLISTSHPLGGEFTQGDNCDMIMKRVEVKFSFTLLFPIIMKQFISRVKPAMLTMDIAVHWKKNHWKQLSSFKRLQIL